MASESTGTPRLFQPITVGNMKLSHRIVLPPLQRFRTSKSHVPILPVVREYYSQRASVPGTLLIIEATFIAAKGGGMMHVPGIWTEEQIMTYREIVQAIHDKDSYAFLQICPIGRVASSEVLHADDPTFEVVGASDIPLSDRTDDPPRPLSLNEIQEYIQLFATAAKNAVYRAGFDGVEIHGANGYLVDQFIQDVSNRRTDEYGGSIANRARFCLDVVGAVAAAVGEERTALRLSPWSNFNEMGMHDPVPTFSYLVSQLAERYPALAYLHVIEPRISGDQDLDGQGHESNDFLRKTWGDRPYISAGGFKRETAIEQAEKHDKALIAVGRWFISNPDLPLRWMKNLPLNSYDRSTFYLLGDATGRGYTDYPFVDLPN